MRLLAVFVFALLALASTAHAATTVSLTATFIDEGSEATIDTVVRLQIDAGPGEQNSVDVSYPPNAIRITDATAPVIAGNGCSQDGPAALCKQPHSSGCALIVNAKLGDGADRLTAAKPGACSLDDGRSDADLGAGDDSAGAHWPRVLGGPGNDRLTAQNASGGPGNDELRAVVGGSGANLTGDAGNDTLVGGAMSDVIIDGEGDDVVTAGDGDDRVVIGDGLDQVDGGPGIDVVEPAREATATLDLAQRFMQTAGGRATLANVEGGEGGYARANTLIGSDGDDYLGYHAYRVGTHPEFLNPGGADRIDGRGGDDVLVANSSKAVLRGGPGDDLLLPFTRGSDCGPGRDAAKPLGRFDLARRLPGCELLHVGPDLPAIEFGSGRARDGALQLTLVATKTGAYDLEVTKAVGRIAWRERVRLQAGTPRKVRVPFNRQGRRALRRARRVPARLGLRSRDTGSDAGQDVTIGR